MKHILSILFINILLSCSNKEEKEKLKIEKAKEALTIHQIVGVGKLIPENDIIQLASPVNGIVQKIYKKENDNVRIGDLILELDHELEDGKIRQINNELNTQKAQIKGDEASMEEFKAKLNNSKSELQHSKNLLREGAEMKQVVDEEATNVKSLQANLKKFDASVRASKSKLEEIKAILKTAQIERNQKIIKSRINGRILELTVLIGGSVSIAQSLAQLGPEGRIIAISEIDEQNAEKISVGQKGWIRTVGSSDTLSTGTVFFASTFLKKKSLFTDQSGEKEDRRVRTIKLMLDHSKTLLLNARIECVIDISSNSKK
jgi:HlyD family secretion protein